MDQSVSVVMSYFTSRMARVYELHVAGKSNFIINEETSFGVCQT